jgi:hypothetical protein
MPNCLPVVSPSQLQRNLAVSGSNTYQQTTVAAQLVRARSRARGQAWSYAPRMRLRLPVLIDLDNAVASA